MPQIGNSERVFITSSTVEGSPAKAIFLATPSAQLRRPALGDLINELLHMLKANLRAQPVAQSQEVRVQISKGFQNAVI